METKFKDLVKPLQDYCADLEKRCENLKGDIATITAAKNKLGEIVTTTQGQLATAANENLQLKQEVQRITVAFRTEIAQTKQETERLKQEIELLKQRCTIEHAAHPDVRAARLAAERAQLQQLELQAAALRAKLGV